MRKVLFKKWIPAQYNVIDGRRKIIKFTGKWTDDYSESGIFHQWSISCDDSGCTVALVELPDSTMVEVLPSNLKFIETIKEQECMKALQCLYLEVPSVIADDVKKKVIDALNEVKNCTIPDVINRRELLVAFLREYHTSMLIFAEMPDIETIVDDYLKSN